VSVQLLALQPFVDLLGQRGAGRVVQAAVVALGQRDALVEQGEHDAVNDRPAEEVGMALYTCSRALIANNLSATNAYLSLIEAVV
jgi:hypothetical protein